MSQRKARKGFSNQSSARAAPRETKHEDETVWLFGIHAVTAALANPKRRFHRLLASRNAARGFDTGSLEPEIVPPDSISKLLPPGAVHQGLAAHVDPLPDVDLQETCLPPQPGHPVVMLDHVTDPHNVGAVLRSASAFGALAVVTTRRHSPPVTGTLAKSATGAVEYMPYIRTQNLARTLEHLKTGGYRAVGLAEEGTETLDALDLTGPVVLALGAEGDGLRALTRRTCDILVRLPTSGPIGSLNVSVAAAIALYEANRQTRR